MTRLEQLQKQQADMAAKQKQVAKAIAKEKRQEKRRVEQAARLAEQEEAVAAWRFCKSTGVCITVTQNGEKVSYQLAEYVRWLMAQEKERAESASKGGPA